MGRHTGFLILAVLTGLAVSAIAGRTDFRRRESGQFGPPVVATYISSPSDSQPFKPNSAVVLNALRPNSLIVIGSLDTSGAPHQIEIEVIRPSRPTVLHTSLVQTVPDLIRWKHDAPIRTSTSAFFSSSMQSTDELCQLQSRRCFRVPRFEPTGTRRELCEAPLMMKSERVCVYMEQSLVTQPIPLELLKEVCELLENRILAIVEAGMGTIEDVDGDGVLSIVVADIDRQDSAKFHPVRGCVTDQDFLLHDQSDFSGDVIYLDSNLPSGDELASLLAHELTHAAVLSYQLRQKFPQGEVRTTDVSGTVDRAAKHCVVPAWLNEAAAHWIEHRLSSDVPGFADRIAAFRAQSASSPVVASDEFLTFASRRSGSRAAGYLFLKSLLKSDEQLRDFVLNNLPLEERTEQFASVSFRDGFRAWMVDASAIVTPQAVPTSGSSVDTITHTLHGTAVLCITLPEGAESISISSDNAARLEVISRVEP